MNPQDANEVVPFLTSAAAIYFVQKFLKNRPSYAEFVKAMPGAAKWAHRTVALIGSLIAAVGIHYTYNGTLHAGGTVSIVIPGLWDMIHAGSDVAKVFILQQYAYETTKPKPWVPAEPAPPAPPKA